MDEEIDQLIEEIRDHQNNHEYFPGLEKAKIFAQRYPGNPQGQKLLGISYYQVNLYAKSAQFLERVLPFFQSEELAEAHFFYGLVQKGRGLLAEAEKCFLAGIAADPNHTPCYTSLAELFVQNQRIDEAQKIIQKGLDWSSQENVYATDLHEWMGRILGAKGEYGKAVQSFRFAAEDFRGENQDDEDFDEEDNPFLSWLEDAKLAAEITGDELPEDEQVTDWQGKYDYPGTGSLTINIEREFFEAILTGEKTVEYRSASEYWIKRIKKAGRPPFLMRVINGMSPNAPELTITVESIKHDKQNEVLEFHLGELKSVKNHDRRWS